MKKGIILSFISQFLIASCLMPFFFSSDVLADTLVGEDAVGTDVSYSAVDSIQYQGSSTGLLVYFNTGTVHVRWKLKKAVIGVVRLQFDIEYFTRENNQWTTATVTEIVNAKLNGDTFDYEFNLNSFGPLMYTWMDTDNNNAHTDNPLRGWSTTILNSNVTFYDDLTSLQGIIDILEDIYSDTSDIVGLSTNQLSELQSILQQCQALGITLTDIDNQLIDVNEYLDYISQYRQYNFPIESFSYVSYFFARSSVYPQSDFYTVNGYYQYPRFKCPNGYIARYFYSFNDNAIVDLVCILSFKGSSLLTAESSMTLQKREILNYWNDNEYGPSYLLHYTYLSSRGNQYVQLPIGNYEITIVPIFLGERSSSHLSTDFALNFGLSNQLLDDLHLIAQGTQQSNSASDDLADNTSQFESDRDSYISFEDDMIGDMDDSLNQINPNVGISGFGGYFMNSAVWVRTQFDRLTNNNPYGSLVVYGLTLGIALLFLGKVFL